MTIKPMVHDEDVIVHFATVGVKFNPGKEANLLMAKLLNLNIPVEDKVPNFCSVSGKVANEYLEELGVTGVPFQTGENQWVICFSYGQKAAMTVPFDRVGHALAATLHHVLLEQSGVT